METVYLYGNIFMKQCWEKIKVQNSLYKVLLCENESMHIIIIVKDELCINLWASGIKN